MLFLFLPAIIPQRPNHSITPFCPRMSLHIPKLHLPVTFAGIALCSMVHLFLWVLQWGRGKGLFSESSTQYRIPNIGIFTRNLWGSWLMITGDIIIQVMRNPQKSLLSPIVSIFFPACTWPSIQLLIKGVNKDNNILIWMPFQAIC